MPGLDNDKNFRPFPVGEFFYGGVVYKFLIPSFQRGYRWEKKQVIDLLEDIKQFACNGAQDGSYFLQPLVVKRTLDVDGSDLWEVLDGQQRLTTLLLILKEFISGGHLTPKEMQLFGSRLYKIRYRNRPQLDFDNPDGASNIDGYYLANAKSTIKDWFEAEAVEMTGSINKIKETLFQKSDKQVKFIWYAIDEDSEDIASINIFNRLNKGKIGLTSSELIKALFIMDASGKDIEKSQQLSIRWNEMEKKFQDDKFWYFISDDQKYQTRIDLLFDFVAQRGPDDEPDTSYRKFQNLYDYCQKKGTVELSEFWKSKGIDEMDKAWNEVKKVFDRLIAWYEDNMYYHYVGFLVNYGSKPLEIYNAIEDAKLIAKNDNWMSSDTEQVLHGLIREKFKEKGKYLTVADIDKLDYYNKTRVPRLLLLFNVQTYYKTHQRFAFDEFRNPRNGWDIEHIDSQNNVTLESFEDRIHWLKDIEGDLETERKLNDKNVFVKKLLDSVRDLIEKSESDGKINLQNYRDLYKHINQYYSFEESDGSISEVDLESKNKDAISNLTLLSLKINRSYQDAPFPLKRKRIIEEDQKGESFMPICTRNIFLKYYTKDSANLSPMMMRRWNSKDKEYYMEAIHKMLDPIFSTEDTHNVK